MMDVDRCEAGEHPSHPNQFRKGLSRLRGNCRVRNGSIQSSFWRFWLFVLFSLVLQSDLVVSRAVHADDAIDEFKIAVGSYNQSRWKKSAEQFRQFLTNHETHEKAPLARLYLGQSLLFLEEYKAARVELRRFAENNPRNAKIGLAKFRIGECSFLLDDLPNARLELEAFTKEFPEDPMAQYALPYLGETLLRQKEPTAALAVFESSIERFPKGKLLDDAKFGRARCFEELSRYDEAVAQYRQLIEREDGNRTADALFHLGGIQFERKNYDDAITSYSRFVKNHPTNSLEPTAQLNIGYSYFQMGKFEKAIAQFERLVNDKSQGLRASYWLGRSYKSLGDFQRALEILKEVSKTADQQDLADAILFQQALCERSLQHPSEARQAFEQVLARYPAGEWADDSLHALIEFAIEAGELAEAELLLKRFQKDYSQSGLRLHVELLYGRLNLAQASAAMRDSQTLGKAKTIYESAARRFERVMNESSIAKTKRQAQYYLALTYQLDGAPDRALDCISTLVDQVIAEGSHSDLTDAIVLQADCYQQKMQSEKALEAIAKYIELAPRGRQMARAISIRALAATDLHESKVADAALAQLTSEFADHPLTSVTLQKLAEAAEAREDWDGARNLFDRLEKSQRDPNKRAYALRGIALSQYYQKKFVEAAESFGRIGKEFPAHEIAIECAYYEADSYRRADQIEKAIDCFQRLFLSYAETSSPEKGDESKPPLEFYYKAGRWAAKLLATSNQIDQSDAAYENLVMRFPQSADLDQRLFEWAELNLQNKRYERADTIWRKLLQETPDSPHAARARFNLAESDLIANKLDDARGAFEKLVGDANVADEIKAQSLYQLVTLAVDQQRWDDVREMGKRLKSAYPESEHRYYVDYSLAESFFAGPTLTDENAVAVRQILDSLMAQKDNDKIRRLEWYDRVWVLAAELSFREKKYEEVETIVADLRQRAPQSPFLYQAEEVLGRSYKQQAPPKFEEARAAFERALSNPSSKGTETAAKAQFLIGDTWFHQEKFDEALAAYQKVFVLHEDFPDWRAEALWASARCDENLKDYKQAVETYQLLIKSFPSFRKIDDAKMKLEVARRRIAR